MADKFNFGDVKARLQRAKRELPIKVANVTKNNFVSNFSNEGFDGVRWQEPKRKSRTGSRRFRSSILVQSGRLRRDVANSLRSATFEKIVFSVDNPYAQIHNDGGMGRAFGRHAFKMPKRQFVGQTNKLRDLQIREIKKSIGSIWRG